MCPNVIRTFGLTKLTLRPGQFDLMMQNVQKHDIALHVWHCTFSEKAMHEMKQIRRDSMKPMLCNLAKLAKDVPPNAPLLFGSEEDINKGIT